MCPLIYSVIIHTVPSYTLCHHTHCAIIKHYVMLLSTHCLDPGRSPIISLVVHQTSGQQFRHSSGVCPQIQGWQRGAYVGEVEKMMCVVCVGVTEGAHWWWVWFGVDFVYDLRKCDLFVLSWARVRRLMPISLSSELLMCGDVRAVFCYCLLWLDA